ARIRRDQPAVETGDHFAGTKVLETQFGWVTLCHSKTAPAWERKWLLLSSLTSQGAVLFVEPVRNPGYGHRDTNPKRQRGLGLPRGRFGFVWSCPPALRGRPFVPLRQVPDLHRLVEAGRG